MLADAVCVHMGLGRTAIRRAPAIASPFEFFGNLLSQQGAVDA